MKGFYSYGLLCGRNTRSGGLSRTEEISRTTQLQAESLILGNMWLCAGDDVTSDSDIQQPDPLQPLQQRGAHLAATRANRWISDGTARALAWLNLGVHNGTDEQGRIQERGIGAGEAVGVYQGRYRVGV